MSVALLQTLGRLLTEYHYVHGYDLLDNILVSACFFTYSFDYQLFIVYSRYLFSKGKRACHTRKERTDIRGYCSPTA